MTSRINKRLNFDDVENTPPPSPKKQRPDSLERIFHPIATPLREMNIQRIFEQRVVEPFYLPPSPTKPIQATSVVTSEIIPSKVSLPPPVNSIVIALKKRELGPTCAPEAHDWLNQAETSKDPNEQVRCLYMAKAFISEPQEQLSLLQKILDLNIRLGNYFDGLMDCEEMKKLSSPNNFIVFLGEARCHLGLKHFDLAFPLFLKASDLRKYEVMLSPFCPFMPEEIIRQERLFDQAALEIQTVKDNTSDQERIFALIKIIYELQYAAYDYKSIMDTCILAETLNPPYSVKLMQALGHLMPFDDEEYSYDEIIQILELVLQEKGQRIFTYMDLQLTAKLLKYHGIAQKNTRLIELAIQFFRWAHSVHPETEGQLSILNDVFECQYNCQKFEEALLTTEKIKEDHPNDFENLIRRGVVFTKLNRFNEARECLKQALEYQDRIVKPSLEKLYLAGEILRKMHGKGIASQYFEWHAKLKTATKN